jgi:hypothetical protein
MKAAFVALALSASLVAAQVRNAFHASSKLAEYAVDAGRQPPGLRYVVLRQCVL